MFTTECSNSLVALCYSLKLKNNLYWSKDLVPDVRLGSLESFAAQDLTRSKFNSKYGPTFSPSCAWMWAGG